jgi:hypothetical protein
MSNLLDRLLEKISALPPDEQDAIASQILESLEDQEEWKRRFAAKRKAIRRLAQEALREDALGRTRAPL